MQQPAVGNISTIDAHHYFETVEAPERVAVVLNANAKQVTAKLVRTLKESVPPNCDIFFTESVEQADFVGTMDILNGGIMPLCHGNAGVDDLV